MLVFFGLAWRNIWIRKARTLLTLLGIMLGVAMIVAVAITGGTTGRLLESMFAQWFGKADLVIEGARSGGGFRGRVLNEIQAFPGVQIATPATIDRAVLQTPGRKAVGLTIMGIDPMLDRQVRTYQIAQGQFLDPNSQSYEVLLVDTLAEQRGIQLGDRIDLLISGRVESFRVRGILASIGAAYIARGSIGFVNLKVAQTVFQRNGYVDQIALVTDPEIGHSSESLNQLSESLQSKLGPAYSVGTPVATGQTISNALSGFFTGLNIFTVIVVFAAALIISNTFAMSVVERLREYGMLISLGCGQGQILSLVLCEAFVMGIVGSFLGLGGGPLLAIPLIHLMGQSFGGWPKAYVEVSPDALALGVAVGLSITLLAALQPAWQVSRISPIEAVGLHGREREGFLVQRGWFLGLGLGLVGLLDAAFSFSLLPGPSFLLVAVGSAILLVPAGISRLEPLLRRGGARLYGWGGELGSRNVQRSKNRVTFMVGLVIISTAMVIAVGAMRSSFQVQLDRWIDASLGGDFYLSSFALSRPEVGSKIAQVEGIEAVTPVREMYIKVLGATGSNGYKQERREIQLKVVDPETYLSVAQFRFAEDQTQAEGILARFAQGDSVLITSSIKQIYGIGRGDTIRLRTVRGEKDLLVAGIVVDMSVAGQVIIGSWRDMREYFAEDKASYFLARLAPGASISDVVPRLVEVSKQVHLTKIQMGEGFRRNMRQSATQPFSLFDAMIYIAIVLAILGLANTMAINILERVREIGLLRSVGMTIWQVTLMVLSEASAIALVGAIFGLLAGIPISVAVVAGMNRVSGWQLDYVFPFVTVVSGIILAWIVSQIAGVYAVWRAIQLDVVQAMRSE